MRQQKYRLPVFAAVQSCLVCCGATVGLVLRQYLEYVNAYAASCCTCGEVVAKDCDEECCVERTPSDDSKGTSSNRQMEVAEDWIVKTWVTTVEPGYGWDGTVAVAANCPAHLVCCQMLDRW
jgi:hypothetical protein